MSARTCAGEVTLFGRKSVNPATGASANRHERRDRRHGPDHPEIAIRLSPDGEALLDRVRQERQEEIMKVLAQMPASARRSLLNGLTEFRTAADGGARPGASGSAETFQMPA